MFLKRKKKRYLKVTLDETVLYDGLWDNLPITEEVIIEKSIEFFNDPEPCAIHRGAVQIRLLAELDTLTPVFPPNASLISQNSKLTNSTKKKML